MNNPKHYVLADYDIKDGSTIFLPSTQLVLLIDKYLYWYHLKPVSFLYVIDTYIKSSFTT